MARKPSKHHIASITRRASEHYRLGRPHLAARALDPVIPHAGKSPETLAVYGRTLGTMGQHESSAHYFRKALTLQPMNHEWRTDYSLALKLSGNFDSALEQIRRARAASNWHPKAVFIEAELLMDAGKYKEAAQLLEMFESRAEPRHRTPANLAMVYTTRTRLAPKHLPAEDVLEGGLRFADHSDVPVRKRAMLWLSIGVMLDKLGRYDEAMSAVTKSKTLAGVPWDAAAHTQRMRACARAWTSDAARAIKPASVDGSGIVFILGMPRSGSSLLEQMLAQHPEVAGLGERNEVIAAAGSIQTPAPGLLPMVTNPGFLTPERLDRLARDTLRAYDAMRPKGVRYVIDKQPFNFVNVPLLARLLPGCKVIHTLRDPRDTALSYLMQWFTSSHGQANSFETLAQYSRDEREMMETWGAMSAPSDRPEMLDVRYEDVANQPEAEMRRVLEFLGLSFNKRVLQHAKSSRIVPTASRDQVRSELYTSSIGRWKNYERYMGPIVEHCAAQLT